MSDPINWLDPEDRKKFLGQIELITRQIKPFRSPLTEETLRQIQEAQKYLQQFHSDPKVLAYLSSLRRDFFLSIDVAARSLAPTASQPLKPTPKLKVPRWKASIGTHAAARRMETYIESKSLDFKEFARRAGTTDRTLRKFRTSGLVRRSVFDGIAKAMELTRDELLKS